MKTRKKLTTTFIFFVLCVVTSATLIPFLWMISASLKTNTEVFSVPFRWIPETLQFNNYIEIWTKIPFAQQIFNTFKISTIITIIQLFTSSFAAYGFAKIPFRGRNALFFLYVATIAVPWQAYMIPQFMMMTQLGLVNSHLSLILLRSFSAFGVFLMRQFFMSIPDELCEAARIDGLNEYGIYYRIILPLSKPIIATLSIFTFVSIWNDFMGPFIYINDRDLQTIQLGLRMFATEFSADYALIMAASVVSIIPTTILFIFLQRFFIEGLAAGGMKE